MNKCEIQLNTHEMNLNKCEIQLNANEMNLNTDEIEPEKTVFITFQFRRTKIHFMVLKLSACFLKIVRLKRFVN